MTGRVAHFIYIDETGSVGKAARRQPLLTLVGVLVHEDQVQPLAQTLREVAFRHLGWYPADFEFHGFELWGGQGYWKGMAPAERLAAYEEAIGLLDHLALEVSHASIDKQRLHSRYGGAADDNAYRLALQFLVEKIDTYGDGNKILVADEAKEQELHAIKMVADMTKVGGGEVPGAQIKTIIDSLHYVSSHASPGVQMADLVAYGLQRYWSGLDKHPDAKAGIARIAAVIGNRTVTWRQTWPR